jgi:hypothetical protein
MSSGLGGLNKSPNGVVLGMVQLQLPTVVTTADLAAQTQKIVDMVGKAQRNLPAMDLVVFPEYSLHGLSMDTNPEIMCRMEGPEVAAFKKVRTILPRVQYRSADFLSHLFHFVSKRPASTIRFGVAFPSWNITPKAIPTTPESSLTNKESSNSTIASYIPGYRWNHGNLAMSVSPCVRAPMGAPWRSSFVTTACSPKYQENVPTKALKF